MATLDAAPLPTSRTDVIRVLHVLPGRSGAPYFQGLAKNFDRARFDWHFLTLEEDDEQNRELAALEVRTFGLRAGSGAMGLARATRGLRAFLKQRRYDLIHLHLFPSLAAGGIVKLLGTDALVLASHHYGREPFLYRRNLVAQWIERTFCRRLDHVIAVSQDIADYLHEEIGVSRDKTSLIHYGFDFEELTASSNPGAAVEVRRALGLDGQFVVGSVARLHWTKGQAYLLEAVARLKHDDGVAVQLLLLGTGPQESELRRQAEDLDVSAEVRFLGWREETRPYYGAMDAFCHPSLQKGYEQVTVEAMALGKAVVGTPVGIAREMLRDGDNGLVVPERDAPAIYRALRLLQKEPELRRRLGERAAAYVRQQIPSRLEMTERYEAVYEGLLAGRAPAT